MDEGSIVLDYESPPGTSLEETDRMLVEVEKIIHRIQVAAIAEERVRKWAFITEPNRGDYLIQLKKDRSKTSNDVIDEIRVKVLTASTTSRFWSSYWRYVSDLMSSVSPIEVKVLKQPERTTKK
jgi:multidrug efflux pump subunit AcrB